MTVKMTQNLVNKMEAQIHRMETWIEKIQETFKNLEDCSIHLCLFCCLAYRVIVNRLSKFHMYVLVYCIGVFLSDLLHSLYFFWLFFVLWNVFNFLKWNF